MKQRYSISEMAELLGVTTHMLRHYEKVGIIQPEVHPENGYRFYTVLDTRRFNLSRLFLACGLSLEACAELLGSPDANRTECLLEAAVREKQLEIEKARVAMRFLNNLRGMYPHLQERVNRVWVENLPKMWRLNVSQMEKAVLTPELRQQREAWLACQPGVYWTSCIRRDTLRDRKTGPIEYDFGLMCYESDALAMGLRQTPDVEVVAGGDYLVTIHEKSDRGAFTWEDIAALTQYMQDREIRLHGDAFSHILASRCVDGRVYNDHRIFLKIYT